MVSQSASSCEWLAEEEGEVNQQLTLYVLVT